MEIIVSKYLPDIIVDYLKKYGNVHTLECDTLMPKPISSHPDSLIFIDKGNCIIPKNYVYGKEILKNLCLNVTLTLEDESNIYPYDTLVNSFIYSNICFSGKNISNTILEYIKNNNYKHVIVNQGYAHCSSIVFKDSIITQDKGIYIKAKDNNIDTLLVEQGNILLPGYDCGFIGGSCIVYENEIIFFGDVTKHPSYKQINSFVTSKCGYCTYFKDFPLTDFGGGVTF